MYSGITRQLLKVTRKLIALDEEGDGSGFQYLHDVDTNENDELDRAEKSGKKYVLYKKVGRLWRIRACKSFSDVKKGELGGFVQSECNLSHQGNCWVYNDAKVFGNAVVSEDAQVYNDARVYGNTRLIGNAQVYGSVYLSDDNEIRNIAF